MAEETGGEGRSTSVPPDGPKGLSTLVVSGDAGERWVLSETLRARGHSVVSCATGATAWAAFQESPVHLVLLDASLPAMDGSELCRLIRSHPAGRGALLMVVTDRREEGLLADMLDAGADDFTSKPIEVGRLELRLAIAERRIGDRGELAQVGRDLDLKTAELEVLVQRITEVFISVDLVAGRVIEVSPQIEDLIGVGQEAFLADPDLWRSCLLPGTDWAGIVANPPRHTMGHEYELAFAPRGPRWIRASVSVMTDPTDGTPYAHAVLVDQTAEYEALVEASARNADLKALYRLFEIIIHASALSDAQETLLDHVREVLGCPIAAIELLDASKRNLVVVAARGTTLPADEYLSRPVEEGLSGEAVRSGRPLVVTDRNADPKAIPSRSLAANVSCHAAFPLWSGDEVAGTLTVASTEARTFDERFLRMGTAVASGIGLYLRRLQAEVALRDSEARHRALSIDLQHANQELEAFAYTVSHDLRAPLRTMQGFAHTLVQNFGDALPDGARNFAERIIAAGQDSERLINDLLEYSRVSFEEIDVKPVELSAVLESVLTQIQGDVERTGARLQVPNDLPPVLGSHTMLVQVFTNLLSNAMKFVSPGRTPEVALSWEERGSFVRLRVEDNGIGIPAGQERRIFNVFERLGDGKTHGGTGIGLAIVRRCMQRMSGSWGVERLQEGGTAFWVQVARAG